MIKVLIERNVAEGLEANYEHTMLELLNHAAQFPGYLGGQSFRNAQKPNCYIIVSNWEDINVWQHWLKSPLRKEMMNKINIFLSEQEKFTILEPCVYQ